jgi:hypothetical protein
MGKTRIRDQLEIRGLKMAESRVISAEDKIIKSNQP